MDTKLLLDILNKHIDEKGLVKDLAVLFLLPFLQKIVDDSSNKFDDMALAEIKKYLETKL